MKTILALGFVCLLLTGCVAGIGERDYQSRLRSVQLGTTKKDFCTLFPEGNARGARKVGDATIEVIEVKHMEHVINLRYDTIVQWFYFYKGQLVQYGQPNDWPQKPDEIIEIRNR